MTKAIIYWDNGKDMETTVVHWGNIGIMAKKVENSIYDLKGFRVQILRAVPGCHACLCLLVRQQRQLWQCDLSFLKGVWP